MSNITLRIDGVDYTNWLSASVDMDVRTLAWGFSASVTTPVEQPQALDVKKGDRVEVRYQEHVVLTGYVDAVSASHDAQNVSLSLSGRSLTGQLTDSSAVYEGGQFDNLSLSRIAEILCEPFGIDVQNIIPEAGPGILQTQYLEDAPFDVVRIEQGESVFELLERLARQRGVLLTTNAQGALVITRAGTTLVTPALRLGVNIKAANGLDGLQQRASQYIIKGSTNGGLKWNTDQASGNAIVVYDRSVPLYRPRIVVCESELSAENARARGQWQR
ncbi:phage tail protein, partial [Agarivorans sp. B2Z047]